MQDGSRLPAHPPAVCADVFQRWLQDDCYCATGLFWQQAPQVAGGDAGLHAHRRRLLQGGDHPWCGRRGLDVWGLLYDSYAFAAGCGFTAMAVWSALRLFRGFRVARETDRRLQVAIHVFCLVSSVVRLGYIICEATLVHQPRTRESLLERLAGASYTAFFPLSAAAFLCICQYWLRLIDFMDQAVEKPWYQNPLILLCLLFLILEAGHDFMYLQGEHFVLEGMYFFWLSCLSVGTAFLGVSIAWHLYRRMRSWLTADAGNAVFKRTLVSSALVSASSVCMLILSVVQALVGRYFPWPCFECWVTGRLLELAYLVMVLLAVGRAEAPEGLASPNNSVLPGLRESSFAESVTSQGSPGGWEAFWISPPQGAATGRHARSTSFQSEAQAQSPQNAPPEPD